MNDADYAATWNGEDTSMPDTAPAPVVNVLQQKASTLAWLGKIQYCDVIGYNNLSFVLSIITDQRRIRVRIRFENVDRLREYDPWSKDWEHHLTGGLDGLEIVDHEAKSEDCYGAKLSEMVRKMKLEERADQDESPAEMAKAVTIVGEQKIAVKRYTTRKQTKSFLASSTGGASFSPFDGNY